MNDVFLEYAIEVSGEAQTEMLLGMLMPFGFEGFEEKSGILVASGREHDLAVEKIDALLKAQGLYWRVKRYSDQNWNVFWESNFEPVCVGEFCRIRAHFHAPLPGVKHELVITPKMSFGTGHHATTWQMIDWMQRLPIAGARIFDFGTGTGVLAILAEKMGASQVEAMDNDPWSIANAAENFVANQCVRVKLWQGSTPESASKADVVLANINKNVILDTLPLIINRINPSGCLLLSGLLSGDQADIEEALQRERWKITGRSERNGWIALVACAG